MIIVLAIITRKLNKKSKIKVCLCVIGKNENLYVKEFVNYYKKIGYNNIFIYDNNEKNGEHFEEVIKGDIKTGFVKIIDFRERNKNSRPQIDAYKECYKKNKKIYDWLSFFDIDEFLEINEKYKTIQAFLNDKIFQYCQVIEINWLTYINDKNLYYENKPLQERIKTVNYNDPINQHIKSTIRGNLNINYWENAENAHTSTWNFTCCGSSGNRISFDSPFNKPPDFTNAKLKHYWYKSFEEFCIKFKRGRVSIPEKNRNDYIYKEYKQIYLHNKNNKEKLKIINRIFNDSIFKLNVTKND